MILIENEQQFDQEVVNAPGTVMADFYADWCGPCKALAPLLAELDRTEKDYQIAKINVDAFPELAQKYRVASIPTILIFKNGEVAARHVGFATRSDLEQMV